MRDVAPSALYVAPSHLLLCHPEPFYVTPSRKARGPSLRSGRQKERRDDKKNGMTKRKAGRQKEWDDKKKGGKTKRKACLGVIKKRAVGLLCKPKNGDRMSFYVKIMIPL